MRTLLTFACVGLAWGWQPTKQPLERAAEEFKVVTQELGLRSDSPAPKAARGSFISGWHGRVYENFRNDKLDATPHEVVQRGGSRNLLRRNQFGFNVGGPLVIPRIYEGSRKTFFNVSYEGVRERIGRSTLSTVAIDAERSGDFSRTVDPAGNPLPIYDPQSTRLNASYNPTQPVSMGNPQYARDPFAGNLIPATRLDPVAMKTLDFYPRANSNAGPFFRNNYFVFSPETNQANGMIFKVDHTVGERHRLTFNGSFTSGLARAPRLFDTIADSGLNDRDFSARRGVLDWTFTRNASTVHALTFDVQSDKTRSNRPGQQGALATIGLQGPLRDAFPAFRFAPYLPTGRMNPSIVSGHNYFYLTDAISTRLGKHRLRGSGQVRRYQVNAYAPRWPAGSFDFGPSLTSLPGVNNTGHGFASFLLGLAEGGAATIAEHPSYWRGNYFRLSGADTYEYAKNLVITASFALEMTGARTEKFDRFGSVDLSVINPANGRPGALIFANRYGVGRALQ